MSLTGQLHTGQLGRWCDAHLPGTGELVETVMTAAAGTPPVRPDGPVNGQHWASIGGAFGQRLAFLVEPAAPVYPLLGALGAGILTPTTAHAAAARFPGPGLPPVDTSQLAGVDVEPDVDQAAADFLRRLAAYLDQHAPAGRIAAAGVEAGLARCCWVLAGWETAYRTGRPTPTDDELYHGINPVTVEAMRASASDRVVAELVALADRLDHAGLDPLRQLAGDPPARQPLGLAAPSFVDGWADGDLLVGDCLVDVKTVISLREPARIVRWLWQLLGYAWLDQADRYRIRRVGLYLARHGRLVTWPLDTYAATLAGDPAAVEPLRGEFLALVDETIAAERVVASAHHAGGR